MLVLDLFPFPPLICVSQVAQFRPPVLPVLSSPRLTFFWPQFPSVFVQGYLVSAARSHRDERFGHREPYAGIVHDRLLFWLRKADSIREEDVAKLCHF